MRTPRSPSWRCGGTESHLVKLILKAHEWHKLCKGRVATNITLFCLLSSSDHSDYTSHIDSCIGSLGWRHLSLHRRGMEAPGDPDFLLNSLCLKVGIWQMPHKYMLNEWSSKTNSVRKYWKEGLFQHLHGKRKWSPSCPSACCWAAVS